MRRIFALGSRDTGHCYPGHEVHGGFMTLTSRFDLTCDNPASSAGQPVLVERGTGATYAPSDIISPYPKDGPLPAAQFVRRIARSLVLGPKDADLVTRFCALGV